MTSISTSVATAAAAAVAAWIIIISLHDATVMPVLTKISAFSCNYDYKYHCRRQHFLYQQHDHERQWQWQWQPHRRRRRRRQQQPHLRWQQLNFCIKEQKENEDEIDMMMLYDDDDDDDDDDSSTGGAYDNRSSITQRRRKVLQTLLIGGFSLIAAPSTGRAGEVGARITKAVTTSDLGVSVRTSVVKGAQFMDKIDGQWEKFSDTYGLGSERMNQQQQQDQQKRRQNSNQKNNIIMPLNINTAQQILDISDDVFLKSTSLSLQKLNTKIEQITKLTKSSFERSGVVFPIDNDDLLRFQTASQFNFIVYAHFKAYSELILENENKINFSKFRIEYERTVGQRLIDMMQLVDNNNNLNGSSVSSSLSSSLVQQQQQQQQQRSDILKNKLLTALEQTDSLGRKLRDLGLVSRVNRDRPETTDDLQDFVDDALADLVITVAVDGDVTLQSQILLQEQGYRLYPNFNRFIVTELFREAIQEQQTKSTSNGGSSNTYDDNNTHKVSVMDYYFDTNYNSDPDKFEVKEVMLNISIE
jgi:hypothetical protein